MKKNLLFKNLALLITLIISSNLKSAEVTYECIDDDRITVRHTYTGTMIIYFNIVVQPCGLL